MDLIREIRARLETLTAERRAQIIRVLTHAADASFADNAHRWRNLNVMAADMDPRLADLLEELPKTIYSETVALSDLRRLESLC